MPDKQSIECDMENIPHQIHHFFLGSIIKTSQEIIDAYVTLFEGEDVVRPSDAEPALARYYLDSAECGSCNAYIMGM
jgi:hypothetical protein